MKKDNKAQSMIEYIWLVSFVFVLSLLLTKFLSSMLSGFLKNLFLLLTIPIP